MAQLLEAAMLIIFGASWPAQIIKTVKVKNPAGKSFTFAYLIMLGYLCGIASKFAGGTWRGNWVIWLYVLDILMVATDTVLCHYYIACNRKKKLEKHDGNDK